jgi:hypothetical protein
MRSGINANLSGLGSHRFVHKLGRVSYQFQDEPHTASTSPVGRPFVEVSRHGRVRTADQVANFGGKVPPSSRSDFQRPGFGRDGPRRGTIEFRFLPLPASPLEPSEAR